MSKQIFKVKILNWDKHNKHSKRSHKYTMISNNFFHDAKIKKMSPGLRCLFLGLILNTADNANDTSMNTPGASNDTSMIHECYVNELLMNRLGAENALSQLEQLQLVTYEKMSLIKELIKEVSKHGVEKNTQSDKPTSVADKSAPDHQPKASRFPIRLENIDQFQKLIPQNIWDQWHEHFEDEFVDREMNKALMWAMNNPKRNRKTAIGWSRMMTRWLQDGWDKHLTKLPKENANKVPEFRI